MPRVLGELKMRAIAKYAIFLFIGMAVGSGSFSPTDWQWWVWIFILNLAIGARDWAMGHNT
jgi:fatty acid desaturase